MPQDYLLIFNDTSLQIIEAPSHKKWRSLGRLRTSAIFCETGPELKSTQNYFFATDGHGKLLGLTLRYILFWPRRTCI